MTSFEDELGVYIGPATTEEAVRTLADHTPGEWALRLTDPDGNMLWHKTGWSWHLVQNDEEAMFAIRRLSARAGVGELNATHR